MVRNMRRGHDGAFKAKVALESIKGEKTPAQLSSEFGVHANQIGQWRKQVLKELPSLFSDRRRKQDRDQEDIRISMDGRGRVYDNIFVERGGQSNTRRFISINNRGSPRLAMVWADTSSSTIRSEFMRPWAIGPLMRYMSKSE